MESIFPAFGLKALDAGGTVTIVSEADLPAWKEASQPVIDAWVKSMDRAGLDGQAMLNDAEAMLQAAQSN